MATKRAETVNNLADVCGLVLPILAVALFVQGSPWGFLGLVAGVYVEFRQPHFP